MSHRLAFWRTAFAVAVHAAARFPRLVPMALVEYVDERLYTECMRATLPRVVDEARTWDSLCGDGPQLDADAGEEHAAMVDLHGVDVWPHSGDGRKGWCA